MGRDLKRDGTTARLLDAGAIWFGARMIWAERWADLLDQELILFWWTRPGLVGPVDMIWGRVWIIWGWCGMSYAQDPLVWLLGPGGLVRRRQSVALYKPKAGSFLSAA